MDTTHITSGEPDDNQSKQTHVTNQQSQSDILPTENIFLASLFDLIDFSLFLHYHMNTNILCLHVYIFHVCLITFIFVAFYFHQPLKNKPTQKQVARMCVILLPTRGHDKHVTPLPKISLCTAACVQKFHRVDSITSNQVIHQTWGPCGTEAKAVAQITWLVINTI